MPLFVAMILDKSGSMSRLTNSTVDGFNEYVDSLRRDTPDAQMSLTLFDSECDAVFVALPVGRIRALTTARYQRGGMGSTALNDAIGKTAVEIERTGVAAGRKVLVVVTTDGLENASREWTSRAAIADLIARRERDGWKFVFFGTEIDAYREGESMNIPAGRTRQYDKSDEGTRRMFRGASAAAARFAVGDAEELWTAELDGPPPAP